MRKICYVLLCFLLASVVCFAGCGKKDPPPEDGLQVSVEIAGGDIDLLQGETKQVEVVTTGTGALTLSTSNPEVATVSKDGVITGVAGGYTTLTATYGEKTATKSIFVATPISADNVNSFDSDYVNLYGRTYMTGNQLHFDHVSSAIEIGIVGTSLSINLTTNAESYMRVFVDGSTESTRIKIEQAQSQYTVVENLTDGYHKIRLVKATEEVDAKWDISSFTANGFATVRKKSDLKIEFIGDSLMTGYATLGSEREWDPRTVENSDSTWAFAYLTAQKLGADYSTIAINGICTKAYHWRKAINMDTLYRQVSMTNTNQYDFSFNPDIIVLNLGSNEASYLETGEGMNYDMQFYLDYYLFVQMLRQNNPTAKIICLLGEGTNDRIKDGIQFALEELNDDNVVFNPFTYIANGEGLAKHPSAEAQQKWAEDLAAYIAGNFEG